MSKYNNVNPGQYYSTGRERPGEGIVHEDERQQFEQGQPGGRRKLDEPHIPNQERASRPAGGAEDQQEQADRREAREEDEPGQPLTDDQGQTG